MWGDERRYEKGQVFLSLFFYITYRDTVTIRLHQIISLYYQKGRMKLCVDHLQYNK